MNKITLRTFYPQAVIDMKYIDIETLRNEYSFIKNRIDSNKALCYDTLLLEALNNEINNRLTI